MKIGIISNSELCTYLLQHLQRGNHEVCLYLGKHSATNGKIDDLVRFCETAGIQLTREINTEDLYTWLKAGDFDSSFIYYYNSRIDITRPEINTDAIFNIHPGALPAYRGSLPVFWQLKKGEPSIGISIHALTERFDAGAVYWEKKLANLPFFTTGNVNNLVSYMLCEGVDYLMQTDRDVLRANAREQDEEQQDHYSKPVFADIVVDWRSMEADAVEDLVKACNPWNLGAWTYYNFLPLTLVDVQALDEQSDAIPGTIISLDKVIRIACASGTVLQVNFLRLNEEFVNTRHAESFGFITGTAFNNPPESVPTN